ncbi:hypothetical protein FXW78_54000 [Rhodococcus opacus]|nr:hypothetical protein [Rhodococcus opacus]
MSFPRNVLRAGVALNGFKLDYDSDDHHINIRRSVRSGWAAPVSPGWWTGEFRVGGHYALSDKLG